MPRQLRARGTEFTIAMPRPWTHLYEVEMRVPPFPGAVRDFDLVMPAWTPGSYFIRDFARNVRDVEVSGPRGEPLAVRKTEKGRWRVSISKGARGPFTARYKVYAGELTVRTSHLDASHGYGNGASLFLYVEGRKEEPQRLRFVLPKGWKVSIALPGRGAVRVARNYDELVDSPFECGTHRTLDFTVRGVPHQVAIWGKGNEDAERFVSDISRIVEAARALFGSLPYERYVFIVHLAAGAKGGLEHRASQSVGISPWDFRPEKSYRSVLALIAHEFFHAWNVKRIHPEALGPFEYGREVYTRDLWAMEGVTSYYQWLLLLRAGLAEPRHAFDEWAKQIREHRESPGTRVQSAEEASFDAWIRLYRPDENSVNVSESYYRRGMLIALALDLSIRRGSEGAKSLDDVLRFLDRKYGARGVGYPEGGWERAVRAATGFEPQELFDRFIRGRETPPFESLLGVAGLVLAEKEAGSGDEGPERDEKARKQSDFGWKTKTEKGTLSVVEVYDGRPARAAGIDAGDELVAVGGTKADEDQLERIERDVGEGTPVVVHYFRRSVLGEAKLVLGKARPPEFDLREDPSASEEARRLYAGWLGRGFPAGPEPPPSAEQSRARVSV